MTDPVEVDVLSSPIQVTVLPPANLPIYTGVQLVPIGAVEGGGDGGDVPDATDSVKGILKLSGDLGGTADAPTVPGLDDKYELPGTGIPASDLASAVTDSLDKADTAVQPDGPGYTGGTTLTVTKKFNKETSWYNLKTSNTRKARAAAENARAGTAVYDLVMLGASTAAGVGNDNNVATDATIQRIGQRMRKAGLNRASTGWVMAWQNLSGAIGADEFGADSRISYTKSTTDGWYTFAPYSYYLVTKGANKPPIVFTPGVMATKLKFAWSDATNVTPFDVVITNSGGDTIQSDTTTVTASGETAIWESDDLDPADDYILTITPTDGSKSGYITAFRADYGNGYAVTNAGVSGASSSYFPGIDVTGVLYYWLTPTIFDLMSPQLTIIDLDLSVNDADLVTPVTVANFKTSIQSIITTALAVGDVILVAPHIPKAGGLYDNYTTAPDDWREAYYELADTNDVPLFDCADSLGRWEDLDPLGAMYDDAHGTSLLYELIAQKLAPGVPGAWGGGSVDSGAATGGTGEQGPPGTDGADGESAYQIAVDNGFEGDQAAWLASLKGDKGDDGDPGTPGTDGADGESAYQIAVDNGFEGDETAWLASLKGEKGDDGDPGTGGGLTGPESSTDGNLAVWDGTDGATLKDGGAAPTAGTTSGTFAAGDDERFTQTGNAYRIVYDDVGSEYPARPSWLGAGLAHYIGPEEPTDGTKYDTWTEVA